VPGTFRWAARLTVATTSVQNINHSAWHVYGPGIQIDDATYRMPSVDCGLEYRGFSVEGEYYYY
jgi:hypothetical protein